jgi:hypothetical protein
LSLPWARPNQSIPLHSISTRSIWMLFTTYSQVFPVASFPLVFLPINYTRSSSSPFVLHALIRLDLIILRNYTCRRVHITQLFVMQNLRFSQRWLCRMTSPGMLCRVALVRTDVSEECSVSIMRVTKIGELGTPWWWRRSVLP